MKLRLRDDSIRLRLMRGEVLALAESGCIEAATRFPDGGRLAYEVRTDSRVDKPGAGFRDGRLTVVLPAAVTGEWAEGDAVAIDGEQTLAGGGKLNILVEKDFQCLAPRPGEDESDLFPHPQAGKETC